MLELGGGGECPLSKGPKVDIVRRQKTSDLARSQPRVPSKLLEILDLTKGMSVVEWIGVWVWLIQMRGEGICEGGILCGYGWVEGGGICPLYKCVSTLRTRLHVLHRMK